MFGNENFKNAANEIQDILMGKNDISGQVT